MDNLLNYEKEEISKHNYECFYSGLNNCKYYSKDLYTDKEGMYKLNENNHIQFKYEILKNLGRGQYGKVVKVFDHSSLKNRALKIFRKNSKYKKSYETEITNILFLRSKLVGNDEKYNDLIPEIFDFFNFRGHEVIVFNLYSGNLYEMVIKKKILLSLNKIKIILKDLASGLQFLRKYNIIHGDLKPENILFRNEDSWNVILIDYGLSIKDNENNEYNIQSMWYRAPEIIFKIPYDFRIDLWSLGCVLYELYYGSAAFRAKTEINLLKEINYKIGNPSIEYLDYIYTYLEEKNLPINFHDIIIRKIGKYNRTKLNPVKNTNDDYYLIDIIDKVFIYNPNRRITYEEILESNFLKN